MKDQRLEIIASVNATASFPTPRALDEGNKNPCRPKKNNVKKVRNY